MQRINFVTFVAFGKTPSDHSSSSDITWGSDTTPEDVMEELEYQGAEITGSYWLRDDVIYVESCEKESSI